MAVPSKSKIRESLMEQLRLNGADVAHFQSQIEDYIFLFETVKKMKKSIKENGRTYMAMSAAGKEYEKDNPDAKLLPRYTSEMRAILKDLGLTTKNVMEDDEEL